MPNDPDPIVTPSGVDSVFKAVTIGKQIGETHPWYNHCPVTPKPFLPPSNKPVANRHFRKAKEKADRKEAALWRPCLEYRFK